jgi:hypothetical protein
LYSYINKFNVLYENYKEKQNFRKKSFAFLVFLCMLQLASKNYYFGNVFVVQKTMKKYFTK